MIRIAAINYMTIKVMFLVMLRTCNKLPAVRIGFPVFLKVPDFLPEQIRAGLDVVDHGFERPEFLMDVIGDGTA